MRKEPYLFFLADLRAPHCSTAKCEWDRMPERRPLLRPQVATLALRQKQGCHFLRKSFLSRWITVKF